MAGLYNRLVRAWESGVCSHCELIFSDGMSGSASMIDGGVRLKRIDYDPQNWVVVDLGKTFDEHYARMWFEDRDKVAKYDLLGQFHFIIAPIRGSKSRYWCSESMAAALQLADPWRYGPNLLYAILSSIPQPAVAGFFTPDAEPQP